MTYKCFSAVPIGFQIPDEDRASMSPEYLAELEEGIEKCREVLGERDVDSDEPVNSFFLHQGFM